jgi:hypothetical protein
MTRLGQGHRVPTIVEDSVPMLHLGSVESRSPAIRMAGSCRTHSLGRSLVISGIWVETLSPDPTTEMWIWH